MENLFRAAVRARRGMAALSAAVAVPAGAAVPPRAVVTLLPRWAAVVVPGPVVLAVKVGAPRGCAVARAAVITLAIIDRLAAVVRLLIPLVEVVKQKWERQRDAKADLALSRALGCQQ
jgi:hypothetical protein